MHTENELFIDDQSIMTARVIFRAIQHPVRKQMLELIHKNGSMTVSEIYQTLKMEQSRTSQYLAILRKAQIVKTKRDGHLIYYSINYPQVKHIHLQAKEMLEKVSVN